MSEFTIGYLSWKKHNVLKKTLDTHLQNGLFNIIQNKLIFFQELTDIDKQIAIDYSCNYIGNTENVGILNAFIKLVENCNTKYFIFCENDFLLLDKEYNINKTLEDVKFILDENEYAQVKLSNIKNPGFLYITPTNINEWLSSQHTDFKYKVESFSWVPEPEKYYNNLEIINKNYKWYKVNNNEQIWSNHIYACNTIFLKEIIIPILKFNRDTNTNLDIKYQGLEDTLCFPENILNTNNEINEKIKLLKKRIIFSGGGNFYHNKI